MSLQQSHEKVTRNKRNHSENLGTSLNMGLKNGCYGGIRVCLGFVGGLHVPQNSVTYEVLLGVILLMVIVVRIASSF